MCSRPTLLRATGPQSIGYSNDNPGGYGEYMRLSEALLLPVPNGLSTEHAALTEPMAVGVHAVAKARLEPDDAPLVIGCGPVGLAVIAALVCAACGRSSPPTSRRAAASWRRRWAPTWSSIPPRAHAVAELARGRRLSRRQPGAACCPVAAGTSGAAGRGLRVRRRARRARPGHGRAPRGTRIVVVGVCMEADTIHPLLGIGKELNLQFVLGYTPDEFAATLRHIAEGAIPAAPLITGTVGVDGVAGAFEALGSTRSATPRSWSSPDVRSETERPGTPGAP